jgi:hypothetical protein
MEGAYALSRLVSDNRLGQMDNTQLLTIALAAVPNMLAVLVGILINNSRLSDTNARISELRGHMDTRFNDVDRRFDEMRDLWRSELMSDSSTGRLT